LKFPFAEQPDVSLDCLLDRTVDDTETAKDELMQDEMTKL